MFLFQFLDLVFHLVLGVINRLANFAAAWLACSAAAFSWE
jgi:hypothetical protein